MIKISFSDVPILKFVAEKVPGSFYVYTMPGSNRAMAIDHIIFLLNDIEKVYKELVDDNRDKFKARLDRERLEDDPITLDRVFLRQLWLMGAYVVISCNLEQIIHQEYLHIEQHFKDYASFSYRREFKKLEKIRRDAEKIKKYRHKIFAHTAFGQPEIGDDPFVLENSLHIFAGTMFGLSDEGMILSGGGRSPLYCCFNDETVGSSSKIFSPLRFLDLLNDVENLLKQWIEVYKAIMKQFIYVSDDVIMENQPKIKSIEVVNEWTTKFHNEGYRLRVLKNKGEISESEYNEKIKQLELEYDENRKRV